MNNSDQIILRAAKNSPFWRVLRNVMDEVVRKQEEDSFNSEDVVASNMRARGARDLRNALLNVVEAEPQS